MNAITQYEVDPIVRKKLDFQIEQMEKYWFEKDPFKTRLFDAVCLTFPTGERYFIESVRKFRDQINNENLKIAVADFIQQEAQHGIAHTKMNDALIAQGLPIEQYADHATRIFVWMTNNLSDRTNLLFTAAFEHMTALMAESFFSEKRTFEYVDPHVRSLLAWHAIEEMEHRDIVFDVMKQVGHVPEWQRKMILPIAIMHMFGFTLYRTNLMLKIDGFSFKERSLIFYKGLNEVFGQQGMFGKMKRPLFSWMKKDFHPNQHPIIAQYDTWIRVMAETNDPIQAGEAFWRDGK